MTRFSDELFTDLMREHGSALQNAGPMASPGGRPHRVRRLALAGGGAGALAVGLTVGLTAVGGGVSPAYAVTQHPDGTLTVAVKQLSGVPGLNQKLQALGKYGKRVVVLPVRAGCPSIDSLPAPKVIPPGESASGKGAAAQKSGSGQAGSHSKVTAPGQPGDQQSGSGQARKSASGKAPADGSPVAVVGNKDGSVAVPAQNIPAGDVMVLAVSSTANSIQMSGKLTSPPVPSCVSLPAHPAGNTIHVGAGANSGPVTKKSLNDNG